MNHDYRTDIPRDLARLAHAGTSFVSEERADQEIAQYARTLERDYDALSKLATTDEKRQLLEEEFARYRAGFCRHYTAYLHSRSRCLSTMIAGPSKFPTRRYEKRSAIADRRSATLFEFRERALQAIRRAIAPELGPIMSGDADACERLRAKIAEAEAKQERMKAVNRAYDRYRKDPSSLDSSDLSDLEKAFVRAWKPQFSFDRHPHPPYEIQNNGANVRRMKERLAEIETAKATPATSVEGAAARLEDSPAEIRIRLFFPGKPEAGIRDSLKRSGFRWTPTLGCWQAYRSTRSIEIARKIAGDPKEEVRS